jgi:predicted nucleic acid-binding protein
VSEFDRGIAEAAGDLVVRHPLRAYDAIQLASVLRAQSDLGLIEGPPVVFVAADDRLMDAAQAEGLQTANPHHHP